MWRGYVKLYRKLIESEIMNEAPLHFKVWIWMLLKAQHADFKGLKRGQLKTSKPEIQEAMAYHVGYRKVKPSIKQTHPGLFKDRIKRMVKIPKSEPRWYFYAHMAGLTQKKKADPNK